MPSDTLPDPTAARDGYVVPAGAPTWAKKVLGFAFPGVFLIYLVQTAAGINRHTNGPWTALGFALLLVFSACYLVALARWSGPGGETTKLVWSLIATMVTLTVVVAPLAHEDVWVMYIFISSLIVGLLGGRGLIGVGALTLIAMFLPPAIPPWHAGVQVAPAFTIPLIALGLFAFFAVVRANAELTEAREEVARLATEGERNRIARDLHDLLGHSLTSITIKAGLARRLSATDPDGAKREIAEVETLAREALADVRAAVGGYREVTLAGELATGREVLRAAGVVTHFPGAVDVVDPAYRGLFGWVVREGLTNVVRHARAGECTITVTAATVSISDDGGGSAAQTVAAGARRGNGLAGLRERVESNGGELRAGPSGDGGWELSVVMLPAPPPQASSPQAGAGATPSVASGAPS